MWEKNAKRVEEDFGSFVDWEERFYICPECGEPIYECDWTATGLTDLEIICPICGFDGEDSWGDDDDDYDEMGYDPYMGCYSDDC